MKRGKPLQRRTPLRTDPEKQREWERRSRQAKPLRQGASRLKRNPQRMARLRAAQFGTDGKREWILSLRSALTGRRAREGDPMTPAHVLGTRATGAGPEGMAPLLWSEHVDFDSSMTDLRFAWRYGGHTRDGVRAAARRLEQDWQRMKKGAED